MIANFLLLGPLVCAYFLGNQLVIVVKILVKVFYHVYRFMLFAFCKRRTIDVFKHPLAKPGDILFDFVRRADVILSETVFDYVHDHTVYAFAVIFSENVAEMLGYVLVFDYARANRVVDVVVYVCDAVAPSNHVSFERCGVSSAGVIEYSVAHLEGQIHAFSVIFEIINDAQRLLVMLEMSKLAQCPLAGVTVRRVTEVVSEAYGFG